MISNVASLALVCLLLFTHGSGEAYCSDYLISGPAGVSDDSLSASSYASHEHNAFASELSCKPEKARLFLHEGETESGLKIGGAWCTDNNDFLNSYLQVEFDDVTIIRAIKTQGRADSSQWVKSYTITYSLDKIDWQQFKNSQNNEVVFQGNNDSHTVVTNWLPKKVEARLVRINPKTYDIWQSLRFDMIGCKKVKVYSYESENEAQKNYTWREHAIQITDLETALWTKTVPHLGACAIFCHKSLCKSFIFDSNIKTCTAFKDEFLNGTRTEMVKSNRYYIRTSFWEFYLNTLRKFDYTIDENVIFRVYTEWTDVSEAAAMCKDHNTTLIAIRNPSVLRMLQRFVQNNLILSQKNRFTVDGSVQTGRWRFSDGTVIPEMLWAHGHPQSNEKECIALTKSGLMSYRCSEQGYFICGFQIR